MFQSTRLLIVAAVIGIVAFCLTSQAEIPQYISYQGKVTDTGGTPVPDGNYTMRFRIYNAASGGSLLWDSNNQSVSVNDGIANVLLGGSGQPALTRDFSEDYWLLVTFQGTDQSPRVRLTSAGYSYMSSGLVPGTVITGSVASPLLTANNTATSGSAHGGSFESASTSGIGVWGEASSSTGIASGVYGQSLSTQGRGVFGNAIASTGTTYGGYFKSLSTGGIGVYGEASKTAGLTIGVLGEVNSSSGRGVTGIAWASTGYAYGVLGRSMSTYGRGVYGYASATTGTNYGVYGETDSASGYAGYFSGNARVTGNLTVDGTLTGSGVGDITAVNAGTGLDGGGTTGSVTLNVEVPLALAGTSSNPIIKGTNNGSSDGVAGIASATTGQTNGVYARSHSTQGRGVYGEAWASTGTTYGGRFQSNSTEGRGVYGSAGSTTGTSYGGYFSSPSSEGTGAFGWATATTGANYGGYFESNSTGGTGVLGYMSLLSNADRFGVHGVCFPSENWGIGVRGEGGYRGVHGISSHTSGSYTTYGVYGEASGAGTNYGVYASGDLGASGSKTAIVRTANGPKAVYCQESTEVWFEDFGTGVIQNGLATVRLAADFLETVTVDDEHPSKVFVTPKADIGRWWVKDSGDTFELHAPDAPDGAMFDYRVVAKRTGYENLRLASVTDAYSDHFLYPDISDVPASHQAEWLKAEALRQETVHDPAVDR